jgi:hypothetical protein
MIFGLEMSKAVTEEERCKDDEARVEKILATCDLNVVYMSHMRGRDDTPIVSVQSIKSNKPNSGDVKPPHIVVELEQIELFDRFLRSN